MFIDTTTVSANESKKHSTISLLLLAGLLFLRFPLVIAAELMLAKETVMLTVARFIYFIGTYLITAILIWWEREHLRDFWIDLAAAITFLLQRFSFPIGIGLFAAMRRHHARFPSPPTNVWRWALLGAILAIVSNFLTIRLGLEPPDPRTSEPARLVLLLWVIFLQMTSAAVWEEPLFRGFLWGYLRRAQWKDMWIWLFQALLFTLGHVFYLKTEALGPWFIRLMLPSLLIGFIAWQAKSIFASMVTHGVFNASGNMLLHARSFAEAAKVGWTAVIAIAVIFVGIWIVEQMQHRRIPALNQ